MTAADDERRRIARAVEKLTRPYVVSHVQRMPGGGRRTVSTTHQPLITLLRTAGTPSMGAAGAGASERVPIDADAIGKLQQLTGDIGTLWAHTVPGLVRAGILRQRLTPEQSLAAWHDVFTVHADHGFAVVAGMSLALRVTESWVNVIERRFDPPPSIEGTLPCPECGRRWGESQLGDRVAAITITYGGSVATSSAICRSCGTTWLGRQQLEDLAAGRSRRRGGGHVTPSSGDTEPVDRAERHAGRNI